MIRLIAVCVIFAVSCYAVPVSVNSVSRADKIPYQREIYKTGKQNTIYSTLDSCDILGH